MITDEQVERALDEYGSVIQAACTSHQDLRAVERLAMRAALEAAPPQWQTRKPPELLAAFKHIDAIAQEKDRPTEEDYRISHRLLVDLVLAPPSPGEGTS